MITAILFYKGTSENIKKFASEMISSGTVAAIRKEEGNLRYEYFFPLDDKETLVLIDSWENQESLDKHHASPIMKKIIELRNKYDLHMEAEKYQSLDMGEDNKFIRK